MDRIVDNLYLDAAPDFYRSLDPQARLRQFQREGVEVVVSLRELEPFADAYRAMGMEFHHIPILDFDVPTPIDVERFLRVMAANRGRRVLVHCLAGLGRAGTMAGIFLRQSGLGPDEAIAHVRRCRPDTIQTGDQEDCVRDFTPLALEPDP